MSAKPDGTLRYKVKSDTRPGVEYTIELDHYNFSGACSCPDFRLHLEPLLRRGVTPEEAIAMGLVKLKKGQRPSHCLKCKHIVDAFLQFGESAARIVHRHENQNHTNPAQHA